MMCAFCGGQYYGESEVETEISAVVKGRCEESAGICEGSIIRDSGGEEVAPVAGGCCTEGDETRRQVSVDPAEGEVGSKRDNG